MVGGIITYFLIGALLVMWMTTLPAFMHWPLRAQVLGAIFWPLVITAFLFGFFAGIRDIYRRNRR